MGDDQIPSVSTAASKRTHHGTSGSRRSFRKLPSICRGLPSIAADEAAFPAIARLLEAQTAHITGSVFLLETVPGSAEYPIPAQTGVSLTMVRVGAIGDWSAVVAALPRLPDDLPNVSVWFAGKDMVEDFRKLPVIQSRRLPDLHIAAC
ncbi:SIP domain-containing protein [Rhizobium leguminosarum]|uniref:SIP domain-containing protein n=1 Tax=Rhizobium leguminosarum TaxID=384 RepID=UPI001C98750F|nr:SIP domain-containing protein [Rhizobium leguminosarum]